VKCQEQHLDVGAYVLGALDDAEATRFEEHLAECEVCAAELDQLAGMEPLLAEYAASAPDVASLVVEPGQDMLDRLLDEVGSARRATRRRRLFLVAAAAALIISGPVVAASVTATGSNVQPTENSTSPLVVLFMHHDAMVSATDPSTKVSAEVAMQDEPWGTHVGLQLDHVQGPLTCDLVAVAKNGQKQTVTSWAVPKWGYGVNPGHMDPLMVHGATGFPRSNIDHFEVQTLDGRTLVSVKV
jgi:anti-sigma factor RsiW